MPAERDLFINIHERREGNALVGAARDLDKLSHGADTAGDHMAGMARDAKALDVEIEKTRAHIRDLGSQFARTGDTSLFGDLRRERSFLAELQKIRRDVDAVNPFDDNRRGLQLPKLDFSNLVSESRGILITGLVGVAALALPAIGAMIAGAVVGATAGGGVVGGVVAAAHDPRVKQAWGDFVAQLTSDAFGGDKMAGPVIASIETLKSTFADLNLDEVLGKGGPALKELTDGIAGFATNLMPGFNAVMDDSEAIMSVFADGLADTGDALSDFLVDILSSKGTLEGLHFLFMFLNGTIRGLGNTLEALGNVFHWLAVKAAEATGALEDVTNWMKVAAPLYRPVLEQVNHLFGWMNDNMEDITGTAPLMASGMTGTVEPTKVAGGAARQSAEDFQKMTDTLKALSDQLYVAQGSMLDADKVVDQINRDMLDLTQSVYDNGTSLDDHTDIGLKHREMLRGLLQDLRAQYELNIKAGMSATEASLAYSAQANALQNTAVQMGFAADEVANLIGMYKQIPPRIDVDIIQHYYTTGTPIGEHSGQRFGETLTSTSGYGFQERAMGGPFGPGMLLVGEHGPELMAVGPGMGGYVWPSMASYANSAGSGVTISFAATGDPFLDAMIRELRNYIRIEGGNVQDVLGRR